MVGSSGRHHYLYLRFYIQPLTCCNLHRSTPRRVCDYLKLRGGVHVTDVTSRCITISPIHLIQSGCAAIGLSQFGALFLREPRKAKMLLVLAVDYCVSKMRLKILRFSSLRPLPNVRFLVRSPACDASTRHLSRRAKRNNRKAPIDVATSFEEGFIRQSSCLTKLTIEQRCHDEALKVSSSAHDRLYIPFRQALIQMACHPCTSLVTGNIVKSIIGIKGEVIIKRRFTLSAEHPWVRCKHCILIIRIRRQGVDAR